MLNSFMVKIRVWVQSLLLITGERNGSYYSATIARKQAGKATGMAIIQEG